MNEYSDYVQMLQCAVNTARGRLSESQLDWLCAKRERAEYFAAVMGIQWP